MTALPVYLKTWDTSFLNHSMAYVSLIDMMSQNLYNAKNYLVATLGAGVWGSCDGTTGDNTDRWSSKAVVVTRAATTGGANSWVVITMPSYQLCISYVGASDDVARISYSPGSLFVLAGTHTFTPTATDEVVVAAATTLINATTSANRVQSMVGTTDRTSFHWIMFRQGTLICDIGFETMTGPGITAGTVVGSFVNIATPNTVGNGHSFSPSAGSTGAINSNVARITGTNIAIDGGGVLFNGFNAGSAYFTNTGNLDLNSGTIITPIYYACNVASNRGVLGQRPDTYFPYLGGGPVQGDTFSDVGQNTRMVLIGTRMQVWDPAQGVTTS